MFCGTSQNLREGLLMIKFLKISLQQNLIFWKKSANSFFYNAYKEKMCTIEIENGREAHWKPSVYKASIIFKK